MWTRLVFQFIERLDDRQWAELIGWLRLIVKAYDTGGVPAAKETVRYALKHPQ